MSSITDAAVSIQTSEQSAPGDGAVAKWAAAPGATSGNQSRTRRRGRLACCSLVCDLGPDYASSSTPGAATRGLAKEESHAEQTASTIHPTESCVPSSGDASRSMVVTSGLQIYERCKTENGWWQLESGFMAER